jgi:hypothetical protein
MEGRRADASEADRREFLLSLGKWSTVFIAAVVGGALLHSSAEGGGLNSRGGWINSGGGGINAGGGAPAEARDLPRDGGQARRRTDATTASRILLRVIGGI